MDIVLEVFDYLFFDRAYATILPAAGGFGSLAGFAAQNASTILDSSKATRSYQYSPSSKFFTLEPTEWAYQSQWQRDTIWRQAVSLFIITWYVIIVPGRPAPND